jgi:hypothetical protein
MDAGHSKRAKPTAADRRAAKRLKAFWQQIPRERRPTQDALAVAWGEGGSQSLMSQYLNGRIPLNIRAVMFFSREFNVSPLEIYPELPGLEAFVMLYRTSTGLHYPTGIKDQATLDTIVQLCSQLSPELQRKVLALIQALVN